MFSFPPNTPTTPTPSSITGIDYLDKRARTVQRRRIDPLVSFASLLETILNELRDMPEVKKNIIFFFIFHKFFCCFIFF